MPDNKRATWSKPHYIEWRSADASNVKVYEQRECENYADYKVGMYYISPFDLRDASGGILVTPLQKELNQ